MFLLNYCFVSGAQNSSRLPNIRTDNITFLLTWRLDKYLALLKVRLELASYGCFHGSNEQLHSPADLIQRQQAFLLGENEKPVAAF